jgi:hypothetical protein
MAIKFAKKIENTLRGIERMTAENGKTRSIVNPASLAGFLDLRIEDNVEINEV